MHTSWHTPKRMGLAGGAPLVAPPWPPHVPGPQGAAHLMKYQNLLRAQTSSRAKSFIRYTLGAGSFSDGFMRPMI